MALFSDSWTFDLLLLFMVIFALFYWFVMHRYTYWERKGFKSLPNPKFLLGHLKSTFTQRIFIGEFIARIYKNIDKPPIVASIAMKWKNMCAKLSPTFASGKLKAMFSSLVDSGASLQNLLGNLCDNGELLDVRDVAASYTTNVIASVGFGIDVDTIKDPNNEFRVCGRKLFEPSLWNTLRLVMNFFFPKMMALLRIKVVDESVEKFIMSVVKQNLDYREKNNVTRKDFFQLLIQIRNTGSVQLDDEWKTTIKGDGSQKALSLNEIAAQVFVFFEAGFETSSTVLAFCMFELVKHPEIQSHVHEEIDRVLQQHNGKITYGSVSEMKYLDACIDDYQIPGTDKVIEKGVQIFRPAFGLHTDGRHYDEPEKFKLERFLDGSSAGNIYLPFGDGPRNCIGMRLGKMQAKIGIILLLLNYKYELESRRDMELDPKLFLTAPKNPVKFRVIKR